MNERTLIKLRRDADYLMIHTVSRKKDRRRDGFYLSLEKASRLEKEREVLANDGASFAVLRTDPERRIVCLELHWLSEYNNGSLAGQKELLALPGKDFLAFVKKEASKEEWNVLSMAGHHMPKLDFTHSMNLRRVAADPVIRKKLSHYLRNAFRWQGATEIRFYDDFLPYSFYFVERRGEKTGIEGGLILHGLEEPKTAYYSIHT